ncbi:T9SS type A sorting domain-containing protein [Pollutibacter soli]|uniref:Ig-like domain-containing protein n=1 Tax=Pollutibacter soli TaxID=3034157 RepID=UPI0030137D49
MRNQPHANKYLLFCITLLLVSAIGRAQAPTITSFSPNNATSGETVTIIGTNFSTAFAVQFGGTNALSFTVVSNTKITAVVGTGSSGVVRINSTNGNVTKSGFTFSPIPTVTEIITDFGGFWQTTTTNNSSVYPNDSHNLLAFTYDNATYATGVNNTALSSNGIAYQPTNFRALPVVMTGNTSGGSLFLVAASKIDGNTASGLYTHPAIKDLTFQSVLTDGLNGLDLGTGYTNLPVGATSNFDINSIQASKIADAEPDFVITQIADPSTSAFDTYRFLDASNNVVGAPLQIDLSKLSPLGTYYLDLFPVANGVPLASAKPTGVNSVNTTRQIRFMAFRLSDFNITTSNYTQIKKLQIIPSGVTDMAFVAYNTATLNLPPNIVQNLPASSTAICNPGGGSAHLVVNASAAGGGTLSYVWEVSTNGGNTWSTVSNNANYTGATTSELYISSATINYQYRATVTESGSNYSSTSTPFTITAIANTPLSGTLNPTGFNNCLNAASGTTSLSVAPSGGTGSYSYQWSSSTSSGGTYTNIPGATSNTYSPSMATTGTTFYKVLITSGCVSNLSSAAQVVISGAAISSVTNGSSCVPGSVTLSATATGGTIHWYSVVGGGSSLGSGSTFVTPSISSTTTYYVGTIVGGCGSIREPVVATIINTVNLTSANFNVTNATDVCPGSGSNVTIVSSGLIDGTYQITYNISGANTVTNASASVTINSSTGSFTTVPLSTSGSNTISITGVQVNGCTIVPGSGNSIGFNVNASPGAINNFNVSVANSCINANGIATVTSNSLSSGTYLLTFDVTGANSITGATAQMIFTAGSPGTGTFSLPVLSNSGNTRVTVTGVAFLASPGCVTNISQPSQFFLNSVPASVYAGTPKTKCANSVATNVTSGSSANNYDALIWSTSGGGFFTNNNTADALTLTRYTPNAADIANGSVTLTLTATPASGCPAATSSTTLTIVPASVGGTVSGDQTIPINTQPADLTLSGNNGTVTKWQRSVYPDFTSATDISVTATTLPGTVIGNLNMTTYFRAISHNGICSSAQSDFATVHVSGSLPVRLLYFNSKCDDDSILLQWATASEINNEKFTIEKSTDGVYWKSFKEIPGAGNSSVTKNYSTRDIATNNNRVYYRLRQTDFDGNYIFSTIIKSGCATSQSEFTISPNPGRDQFIIRNLPVNGQIRVTDLKGRLVIAPYSYTGTNYSINLGGFAQGIYLVTVYTKDAVTTKKLMKE